MKLSEYARQHGLAYETARRQFNNGLIPNAYKLPSGTIVVPNQTVEMIFRAEEEKLEKIKEFCQQQGWNINSKQRFLVEIE